MRGCGVGTMDCGERMKGCDGVMLDYGGRMKGYDLKLMDCVWELRDSQNEARAQEGPPGQLDHHPGNPTTPHLSHCSHYFQPAKESENHICSTQHFAIYNNQN